MLRSLQSAATGMEAQQQLIDTLSNNIANVNTTGYKKQRAHFNDLLYQNLRAPGLNSNQGTVAPSGIQVGTGVKLAAIDRIFSEGAIKITQNDTDLMVEGRGFFRVQLQDGNIGYTRDGTFKRSADGRIVTSEGLPMIPEIVIPPNALNLRVGRDGVVTCSVQGETEPRNLGQIQVANFVNPAGLNSIGRNLYTMSPSSGEPIVTNPGENGTGAIGQGQVEASNVNIVDEMVQMIVGQRAYELNSKVIKTGDEMLASTNQMR
jgi:flagellar basal-body rod protein FlgG